MGGREMSEREFVVGMLSVVGVCVVYVMWMLMNV